MSAGWTKAEYDQCPELADRLHREILDLQDQVAAAERRAKELEEHWREANLKAADVRAERDAWREQALSAASPEEVSESHDNWMYRAKGAERRLGLAREALERIASGWGGPLDTGMRLAREALAALDGEDAE